MPKGIYPRPSREARFWKCVNKNGPIPSYRPELGPCWIWTAATHGGYGTFWYENHTKSQAHRFAYELLVGPIPDDLQLDHLCRVHGCVNPAHLEPVTSKINCLRGESFAAINATKTHCSYGHAFDSTNTKERKSGGRDCRICQRRWAREWARKTYTPTPRPHKTHCKNGHAFDESNTYHNGRQRVCRTCDNKRTLKRYYDKRAMRQT